METTAKAVAALEEATRVTKELRNDVHDYTRVVRRVQWALVAAIVTMVAVLIGVALTVKSATDVIHAVADCTTEGGKCYDEGRKRTGAAVVGISDRTITGFVYTNECSRLWPDQSGPTYNAKLEACVKSKLTQNPNLFAR